MKGLRTLEDDKTADMIAILFGEADLPGMTRDELVARARRIASPSDIAYLQRIWDEAVEAHERSVPGRFLLNRAAP
jgi:hypothetical protein